MRKVFGLTFTLLLFAGGCFGGYREYENLEAAEHFSREEKFDEAIAAYRKHMRYRLSLMDRPEWENPYLYLLMIGDLQLNQGKPEEALASYQLAEKNKVDNALVSDRYRYLASWYEKKGDYDTAIEILTTYRDRDELLFDVMRDRMAKALVEKERAAANEADPAIPATPTP